MNLVLAPRRAIHRLQEMLWRSEGSALLEFALTLPLLVVFVVGIFDFSGAFNQKQKIEQAAQEGAIVAAAQPTNDITVTNANPDSLRPVVSAVFNSLDESGVIPLAGSGACKLPPPAGVQTSGKLEWAYTFLGCSGVSVGDTLVITVNRGWVDTSNSPAAVGSIVTVTYPYHWRFNSVIQLLIPGASYSAVTDLTESATVHNQT